MPGRGWGVPGGDRVQGVVEAEDEVTGRKKRSTPRGRALKGGPREFRPDAAVRRRLGKDWGGGWVWPTGD